MTRTQRFISLALTGVLLVSGFAIGRWTNPTTANANEAGTTASPLPTAALPVANQENSAFYLSDYKTGYNEGYNAGVNGQATTAVSSARPGYNEGFKDGYANGHQAQTRPQGSQLSAFANNSTQTAPTTTRVVRNYRTVKEPVYVERKPRSSKLKTALTIAAPAAIGAGIGATAGGKKGAGVGALIGGGGGALYHLFKNRR